MRLVSSSTLGAVALVLSSLAGSFQPATAATKTNVVLVLVDTLRADHLGLYGYERPTSPHLDRLAASGVVFERGKSQAACTFISVSSLLTGHYPHRILKHTRGKLGVPDEHTSVAEILSKEGYETLAVTASSVVRKTPGEFNEDGGYGKGFDTFDESCEKKPAACVTDKAIELASKAERPFFLYLHYMDPHAPYRPPDGYERAFSAPASDAPPRNGDLRPYARRLYKGGGKVARGPIARLADAYDDEIRYWDGEFARLIEDLRAKGLLEDTLLVLTADHGEDFLEHEDLGHCRTVHETSIHIPVLLWGPDIEPGRRVAAPIENVDVLPTLLDLLEIDATNYALDGSSVQGLISGDPTGEEVAFASQGRLRSVNDRRYKLVYDVQSGERRLYDLESDPGETHDRANDLPAVFDRLSARLADHMRATEGKASKTRSLIRSEQMHNKLRALGYIE